MAKRFNRPAPRPDSEDDLARKYAELEHLYLTSPVGLCLFDRDLRYMRVNDRLAAINGRSVEEHLGRTMHEVIPEIADEVESFYRRVLETGEPAIDCEVSCAIPSDPGTIHHWLVSSYPFTNVAGERIGVSAVVQDVTEIHRARNILEESEARFRALVEQAPDAIVVLDPESGLFVDCNQNAINLFGLDREALLKLGPLDVSPARQPDGRSSTEISRANRAAAVKGEQLTFSWTHLHSDGHLIPCEVRLVRLPGDDHALLRGSILDISERVRAEQALQMSEARYRSLVEHATDAICVVDAETCRFVDCNDNALKLFGLPRERILQIGPVDVSPPLQPDGKNTEEMVRERVDQARRGGIVTFEWTHRNAAGRLVPCEVRLVRLPGDDPVLLRGSVLDISERVRAEQALQLSEARYRTLVENAADAICVLDSETGHFVDCNDKALKLFGLTRERFLQFGPADLSPEFQPDGSRSEDVERDRTAKALQGDDIVTFEWTYRRPDGKLAPCEIRLLRLPGHGGRLVHAALTDISARKAEELVRRQNENRLRMLVESTDAVPWEADLETWMFTYVGPQAERLFGFPLEKWFEKGFWESHIHPEDRESTMRFCLESSRQCENYAFEYRMITASGEILWLHDLVSVEQGTEGTPARLRGFLLDVTARKRAEMLQTGQKRVLERLARGEPLADVLCELANTIDGLQTGMKCSILLLDPEGKELRHGAAPHLPEDYSVLVDGLMIGPKAGSCGTAAYRGERVIVSDISTDPLWEKYRHVALRFDLRSCWSQPILSQSGAVLGTLAVYHEYPNHPSASELEMIEQAAYIAGIAIERQRSDAALRTSETALRRSQADLQHLAGRLISAQEEERRRLARDLHDDLTQRLAVLAIEAGKLEGKSGAPVKVLRDGLRLIRDEMVQLSKDVHGLSRQLHPALLEDLGLVDALGSECERFSERESIKTTFRAVRIPAETPPEVALCFYRVAQECLRNIGKHSGAKRAKVELRGANGAMQLSIRDDGGGFDPLLSRRHGGVGLASMGERIRLVNGSLGVRSRAGQGTTIEVRIPLPGAARPDKKDRSKPAKGAGAAPRAKKASRAARPARRKTRSRPATRRTASNRRRRTSRTT